MADGKVNLVFSTVASLKGLNAVSDGVKKAGRDMKDFGAAGTKLVGTLSAEFSGLGKAMAAPFSLLTEMAHGGIWGLMAEGVRLVISKFAEWRKEVEGVRDEHAKLMRDMTRGHMRRLYSYFDKAEAAENKRHLDAADAARSSMGIVDEVRKKVDADIAADRAVAAAKLREDLAASGITDVRKAVLVRDKAIADSADAIAHEEATLRDLEEKEKILAKVISERILAGESVGKEEAELVRLREEMSRQDKRIQAARINQRAVEREQDAAVAKARERAAADAEREAMESRVDAMRESAGKMQGEADALDRAIAAQRALAAAWEAEAAKARGRDFGDVERERRDDAEGKAAAAFARRNRADERRAQRIAAAGRHARPEDRAWLARFREWRDAQDPRNNPAAKAAEALQKRRDALQQDIKKTLDDIKAELKTANTFG